MSAVLPTLLPPAPALLGPADARAVEDVAVTLLDVAGGRVDDPAWPRTAAGRWPELPDRLRRLLLDFTRDPGPTGTLVVQGLPVDETLLPDTPTASGSVQARATIPAAVLMLATCALGWPVAFRPEKSGALVQDVVPVPGSEEFQGNEGSVSLSFHTENAFHPYRPDFVLLLCLRADHERVAGLRTASIRQVLHRLPAEHRAALSAPEFVTAAPPSFGARSTGPTAHAVLTGDPDDPDLLVDFAATAPMTARAGEALTALQTLFGEHATVHRMAPGDLAVVDNRVTVHGRSAFVPRYDGRDRWIQRTFACQDLRRSRAVRPDDGHVIH